MKLLSPKNTEVFLGLFFVYFLGIDQYHKTWYFLGRSFFI